MQIGPTGIFVFRHIKILINMIETQIEKSLNDLNALVLGGKTLDAFEKYYHDQVEMQENNHLPTKGKDANRQHE